MAIYKINFRATDGYVTDGADSTSCLGATSKTAIGLTFGFTTDTTGQSRNRTTSSPNNPELSGIVFAFNTPTDADKKTFTVTLPSTGSWRIRAAFGDAAGPQTQRVVFKDNTTTIASIAAVATGTNSFADANGTVHTAANWAANNTPLDYTFSTTTLKIEMGLGANDGVVTSIAHLVLESLGGGGSAASSPPPRRIFLPILNH